MVKAVVLFSSLCVAVMLTGCGGGGTSTAPPPATAAATTTTLTSSANSISEGNSVTFTASVTASSGTPAGTVSFSQGSAALGSGTLNSSGVATYSTTALGAGSDSISATYAGTTDFASSTSNTISVNVKSPLTATTTTLAASGTTITYGTAVTFTATVAPSSGTGTPTGTVEFDDGVPPLGKATVSSGSAVMSTTSLPVGANSVTAIYSGDSNFSTSTSTPVVVNVVDSQPSAEFCSTYLDPEPGSQTQTSCGVGVVQLNVPGNRDAFWGGIIASVCNTQGIPPVALLGIQPCTVPQSETIPFNQPVQSFAYVSIKATDNGPELVPCTNNGSGNILATITNPNPNPNATGTVTVTQTTAAFNYGSQPPSNVCYVVAFNADNNAILIEVGPQISVYCTTASCIPGDVIKKEESLVPPMLRKY
jgi:hypothetical protein